VHLFHVSRTLERHDTAHRSHCHRVLGLSGPLDSTPGKAKHIIHIRLNVVLGSVGAVANHSSANVGNPSTYSSHPGLSPLSFPGDCLPKPNSIHQHNPSLPGPHALRVCPMCVGGEGVTNRVGGHKCDTRGYQYAMQSTVCAGGDNWGGWAFYCLNRDTRLSRPRLLRTNWQLKRGVVRFGLQTLLLAPIERRQTKVVRDQVRFGGSTQQRIRHIL
jgi:hypothetical protein